MKVEEGRSGHGVIAGAVRTAALWPTWATINPVVALAMAYPVTRHGYNGWPVAERWHGFEKGLAIWRGD
jgi:hypothetical protein